MKNAAFAVQKKDLVVHHVIKCENNEVLYLNPDNLIVLCNRCHTEYHRNYSKANPKTLIEFTLTKKDKKKRKIKQEENV